TKPCGYKNKEDDKGYFFRRSRKRGHRAHSSNKTRRQTALGQNECRPNASALQRFLCPDLSARNVPKTKCIEKVLPQNIGQKIGGRRKTLSKKQQNCSRVYQNRTI